MNGVRVSSRLGETERTVYIDLLSAWVSYLNIGAFVGMLALALFSVSQDDVARKFAYFYAAVSAGVIVGFLAYRSESIRLTEHLGLRLDSVPA